MDEKKTSSKLNEINWFPGHMAKARNKIEEKIKQCDGVIEIGDARAPFSSFPDYLDKITQDKAKVYIFSKSDLADHIAFKKSQEDLQKKGIHPFVFDLRDKNAVPSHTDDHFMAIIFTHHLIFIYYFYRWIFKVFHE